MRKNNTAIIFGSLFFSCSVMAANGTLAPTVVPMVNGGQASIAISNTSPNLFTVPGDKGNPAGPGGAVFSGRCRMDGESPEDGPLCRGK